MRLNRDRNVIIVFLVLSLMIGLSIALKLKIVPGGTSDWEFYRHQQFNLRSVGFLYPPDLPFAHYTLFFTDSLVKNDVFSILFLLTFFSSLIAVPAFFITLKISKSPPAALLSSLIILFNDYNFIQITYGLLKTVAGSFLYLVFMHIFLKHEKRFFTVEALLIVAIFLTSEIPVLLTILTVTMFYVSQLLNQKTRASSLKKLLVVLFFSSLIYGLSLTYIPILHFQLIRVGGAPRINFQRFYEAFTWLPVYGSLLVFVGTVFNNLLDSDFGKPSTAFAFAGLVLTFVSFVLMEGWAVRVMYLTVIPLSICLPCLPSKRSLFSNFWFWLFLAGSFTMPFFARFMV